MSEQEPTVRERVGGNSHIVDEGGRYRGKVKDSLGAGGGRRQSEPGMLGVLLETHWSCVLVAQFRGIALRMS